MSNLHCPCGSKKFQPAGPDLYKCLRCGGLFDNEPDEGGDYGHRPEARLMREEAARERRRDRLGRR